MDNGNSGSVSVKSGAATGGTGGSISVVVGAGDTNAGGRIVINAGLSTTSTGGSVSVSSGAGQDTSSGAFSILTADAGTTGVSGSLAFKTSPLEIFKLDHREILRMGLRQLGVHSLIRD